MKRKLKNILIIVGLLFVTIFLLTATGCRKKAVPNAIIISAPSADQLVSEHETQANYTSSKVYLIYNGGATVKQVSDKDFKFIVKDVEQIEGVQGYKYVKRVTAFHFATKLESEPIYFVYNSANAILPKPLLNVRYESVNAPTRKYENPGLPNNKTDFIFLNRYGHKYDMDSLLGTTSTKSENVETLEQFRERGLFVTAIAGKTAGTAKAYDLHISKNNIADKNILLSEDTNLVIPDEQRRINPHIEKDDKGNITGVNPIYPKYGGANGIKKGGTKVYRMYLEFDSTNLYEDGPYIKGKEYTTNEATLNFLGLAEGETLSVSHPVFSMGTKAGRPINKQAANWFDYILVIPISAIMWLFGFGGSLGAAIFFTTIVIRTLAWPIYAKTNSMSVKMQEAQPELKKLQDKYRGRTDAASKRAMQMETMQIYRKYKLGFSTFLLPFVQMPIFIGMFQALQRVFQPDGFFASKFTRITNAMGFIDFTQGGLKYMGKFNFITFILAILVGVSMWVLQFLSSRKPKYMKQMPNQEETEQQKKSQRTGKIISYVMLVMMVIFAFQSNAVAFYWIIGNLYSIAQSYIQGAINKKRYLKKNVKTGLEV